MSVDNLARCDHFVMMFNITNILSLESLWMNFQTEVSLHHEINLIILNSVLSFTRSYYFSDLIKLNDVAMEFRQLSTVGSSKMKKK